MAPSIKPSDASPVPSLGTPNRSRSWERADSKVSCGGTYCVSRWTLGASRRVSRSATRSASTAISSSRSQCGRSTTPGRTSCSVERQIEGRLATLYGGHQQQQQQQTGPKHGKLRAYADTSVIGGCEYKEFSESSRWLIERTAHREIMLVVSEVGWQERKGHRTPSKKCSLQSTRVASRGSRSRPRWTSWQVDTSSAVH